MTLFSGGEGAGIGAINAGFELIAGLEYDKQIADTANHNLGNHVRIGNILDQSPFDFPKPDLLHASPPCPNFSRANSGAKETSNDTDMGKKVAEFIHVLQPNFFTLENVSAYKNSVAFNYISDELYASGYEWDTKTYNAFEYSVPQSRRRFIVRATKIEYLKPVIKEQSLGWYHSIKDIVDKLPERDFATWQMYRLPEFDYTFLSDSLNMSSKNPNRFENDPAFTVIIHSPKHPAPIFWDCTRTKSFYCDVPALARFQTFPDWYEFPNKEVAFKIIGNALPCNLYQKIAEAFIQ